MDADRPTSPANGAHPTRLEATPPAVPPSFEARLGACRVAAEDALERLRARDIPARIGRRDHTVWASEPRGIADRLGWLDIALRTRSEVPRLHALRDSARADGFRSALLVGMGGSSLAPDVLRRTFGSAPGGLVLDVLDSTHPDTVRAAFARHDPATTLIVVATKSGTTLETLSLFRAAYGRATAARGAAAGRACIAITDPGSRLEALGDALGFRAVLHGDPTVGGRFSALSVFGMAPAALAGLDVERLIERGIEASARATDTDGVAVRLGAVMAACAAAGRDKLTLVLDEAIAGFGDWIEQLVAESTGKNGVGILPVVGEPLGAPGEYGPDRLFVRLALGEDGAASRVGERLRALAAAGHPIVELGLNGEFDLGAQFVVWEMATAVAGHLLAVQPFDQPDVEAAKVRTRDLVAEYRATGRLPESDGRRPGPDVIEDVLADLGPGPGAYVAVQAFLDPTPATVAALERLRAALRGRSRVAVTLGFGPRYLHSTGQLHKGDGGGGRFVQLISDPVEDLAIPDEAGGERPSLGFATLLRAQALGDAAALEAAGRRVVRIHLGSEAELPAGIMRMLADG